MVKCPFPFLSLFLALCCLEGPCVSVAGQKLAILFLKAAC
jgi:hypothetical protein